MLDVLTANVIKARAEFTQARRDLKDAEEALQMSEADLFLRCDYKALGSNETERKAKFEALKRTDGAYGKALYRRNVAESVSDALKDALETAQDCRRAYENALKAAYLEGQFGSIVRPEDFSQTFSEF